MCTPVEGKLHVWGGASGDFLRHEVSLKDHTSTVFTFDSYLETWNHLNAEGTPPSGLYFCACASAGHYLYTFGGGTNDSKYTGSLHQLDTRTSMWTELAKDGPMKKTSSAMVVYNNQLILFAGYGIPSGPIQPGSKFIVDSKDTDRSGWTNEMHSFDLKEGERVKCVQGYCTVGNNLHDHDCIMITPLGYVLLQIKCSARGARVMQLMVRFLNRYGSRSEENVM